MPFDIKTAQVQARLVIQIDGLEVEGNQKYGLYIRGTYEGYMHAQRRLVATTWRE